MLIGWSLMRGSAVSLLFLALVRPVGPARRRRARWRAVGGIYTHRQLLSAHPGLAQPVEGVVRHALGKIDGGMRVEDLDEPDVRRVDARLVGDGADDVARLH